MATTIKDFNKNTLFNTEMIYPYDNNVVLNKSKTDLKNIGIDINFYNLCSNVLDSRINKDTNLILTDKQNLSEFISLEDINSLYPNNTKTEIVNGNVKLRFKNPITFVEKNILNVNETKFNINFVDLFNCQIYHNEQSTNNKYYLNHNTGVIFFDANVFNFNYYVQTNAKGKSTIIFYRIDNDIQYILKYISGGLIFEPQAEYQNLNAILDEAYLFIINTPNLIHRFNVNNTYCVYNTDYMNNPLSKDKCSDITDNSLLSINYNYIIDYKNTFNLISLKNILTPNNLLGQDNITEGLENYEYRYYRNLYSGLNQETGAYNIVLNYDNFVTPYALRSGKISYFNLPQKLRNYQTININSMQLQEQGAIAGDSPLRADKIFKKSTGYKFNTNNGSPTNEKDGRFLCAWLRVGLNKNERPVWVDRYYFPNKIGEGDALRFDNNNGDASKIYTEVKDLINHEVYDVISNLTLEPGCYYAYHHIGTVDVDRMLASLEKNLIADKIDNLKITPTTSVYINSNKDYKDKNLGIHIGIKRNDWSKKFGYQIFGDLTNKGLAIYNTNKINPLVYTIK